jgi:hypothetical protein
MKDATLICMFCDPVGGFDKGQHKREHTLLSVRKGSGDKEGDGKGDEVLKTISALETKVDSKLSEMEVTFGSLDARIGAINDRLTERMNATDENINQKLIALDEKFTRIEKLLEKLLTDRSGR